MELKNNYNFIITGGLGFIGSNLSLFLASKRYKVKIIDNFSNVNLLLYEKLTTNKNIKIFKKNFNSCSFKFLNELSNKNTIFIHLASIARVKMESSSYLNDLINNNILIINFLKRVSLLKIYKFIFASSSSVYGNTKLINNEYHPLEPANLYGLSKLFGEKITQQYFNNSNNYLIVRIFNVYGMSKYSDKSNNLIFQNLLEKKSFYIEGDGRQKRDFIYIKDVVEALYLLSIKNINKQKIFNIGTGKNTTIIDFVKLVRDDYHFKYARKYDSFITKASISRIRSIGWKPRFSLKKTIKLLISNRNPKK